MQLTGACGVPAGTAAAALNVTAITPASDGARTLYPTDITQPTQSKRKWRAAGSIVRLSENGSLRIFNRGTADVHIVIDVNAHFH